MGVEARFVLAEWVRKGGFTLQAELGQFSCVDGELQPN
jgi:hypothetical protein